MSIVEEQHHKESESLMKITGHHHDEHETKKKKDDSSSSSDSDDESSKISAMKNKVFRLFGREKLLHKVFGREKLLHKVFGGGKPANLLLWKDKKLSGGILGGVSVVWFLFEVLEYHLLTLVCHSLILSLAVLFLWSNASTFINKSPPKIPQVSIPEKPLLEIVSSLRIEINQGLAAIRDIASGKDLKKFLAVIAGLWFVSIISNCYSFLTLVYISVVLLFTVPVVYDKYEDKIDPLAEKAWIEEAIRRSRCYSAM